MKTTTRIKLIEEALSQEEVIEASWILSEADVNTVPVYTRYRDWTFKKCETLEDEKNKEKSPVVKKKYYDGYPEGHDKVRCWSAKENLNINRDWEDFEYAFHNKKIGMAVSTQPEKSLFIIDADTPEEVGALKEWWKTQTREELPEPTVKTPGKYNENTGEWEHKQGGHWYILMPEGMFSANANISYYDENGKRKQGANVKVGDSHFAIRAGNLYCLAPPSIRTDGPYIHNSGIISAEEWGLVNEFQQLLVHKPRENVGGSRQEYEISDVFYDDGESLISRIQKWVESGQFLQSLMKMGLTENHHHDCGGNCSEWKWKGSKSSRSCTIHTDSCANGMHLGQVTVFSETMAIALDVDYQTTWSAWRLVKNGLYDGDEQACIHGEGLHVDRVSPKGRKNQMMRKAQYNKKMEKYKSPRDRIISKYS